MADVFLSYRRDDSRSATGRLADGLQAALGPDRVFRDLDSTAPGEDFKAALARAIGAARLMLVVVGPRWTDIRDARDRRRQAVTLDDAGWRGQLVRLVTELQRRHGVESRPGTQASARVGAWLLQAVELLAYAGRWLARCAPEAVSPHSLRPFSAPQSP